MQVKYETMKKQQEIASVTFRSIRAIEIARLRLRKKLCLEPGDDLSAFLQKY